MEIAEIVSLPKRLKHAMQQAREFYNPQGLKIQRNIDRMLYNFDVKQHPLPDIVRHEL
jgi:hypothetical protein